MTLEQFEKAQEIRDEIAVVLDVESLLLNWTTSNGDVNHLRMYYGTYSQRSGAICNRVDTCSIELKNRLVQTCRDYYHELNKQFDEL
jgi:hypothetical protein